MPEVTDDNGRERYTEEQLREIWVEEPPKLNGPVRIADYDPDWPRSYQREAERIRSLLGPKAQRLEHIGSTSVPGLAAKPIIDILLVVADSADEPSYLPELETAGYRLVIREPERHQHRALKGPDTNINLHVYSPDSPQIVQYLLLRDWLRVNDADRELYERTKRDLSTRDWTYIQQYADAKTDVITEILNRAAAGTGPHRSGDL